jgi:hypothetical protein
MITKFRMKLALAGLGAVFGFSLGSASDLRADEGTYKYCSDWNGKGQCLTCVQKTDCGTNPVCCNPQADE